jgi:murein DD-endopeptidase MepM/ murein hydrolase activator NlpD
MATETLGPDSKERQDQRHNPSEDQWAKNMEQRYNKTTASPSNEDANIAKAKEREEHPDQVPKSGHTNEFGYQPPTDPTQMVGGKPRSTRYSRARASAARGAHPLAGVAATAYDYIRNNPKKSGGIGVGGMVAAVILWLIINLTPGALLIGLKENQTNKFMSNLTGALEERSNHVFRIKFTKSNLTTNSLCAIKVKCKFKGLSNKGATRLAASAEKLGHKLEIHRPTGAARLLGGKTAVSGITFNGQRIAAADFDRFARNNLDFKTTRLLALSPKTFWTSSPHGKRFMKTKILVGKAKAIIGKNSEERKKAARSRVSGNIAEPGQTKPVAGETDEERQRRQANQTDESKKVSDEAEKRRTAYDNGDRMSRPSVSSGFNAGRAGATAIRGVSILGGADATCVALNLISAVGYGAKVMGSLQLIRYAWVYYNTADSVKAGDATTEEVEFLAGILTTPDQDGRTVGESFGDNWVSYGFIGDQRETLEYRVGGGLSDALIGIPNFLNDITGGGSRTACKIITHPITRIGSGLLGLVAAVFSGGTSLAVTGSLAVAAGVVLYAVEAVLKPILIDLVAGTLVTFDENGVQAGNAITAGGGALGTYAGRDSALQPLTKDEAVAFAPYYQEVSREIAAIERAQAHPLDYTNPHSLTGSFLVGISPYVLSPPATTLSKIGSILSNPLSIFGSSVRAQDSVSEYDICTDEEYEELGIAADPFCNPVYGMDPAILRSEDYDPEVVIDYMLDNGHINEDGYPDSGEYEEFIEKCIESTDPLSPDSDFDNDFCVPESSSSSAANTRLISSTGEELHVSTVSHTSSHTAHTFFRLYYLDHTLYEGFEVAVEGEEDFSDPLMGGEEEANQDTGGSGGQDAPDGPVSSAGFRMPIDDFNQVSNCWRKPGHAGIDFAAPQGTPVYAVADGTVVLTGGPLGDAGNYIMIRHSGGLYTNYQHLETRAITSGEVKAGQRIGTSGNTGFSTGPHLHFGVTDAQTLSSRRTGANSLDPMNYLPLSDFRLSKCT